MEPDNKTPEKAAIIPLDYKRVPDEEFFEGYANNVFLEASAWDLKLIFGKLDQSKGTNSVVQYAAITLPWSQVKTLVYFLRVHLGAHEIVSGKILVPQGAINPPAPLSADQEKAFPRAKEVFGAIQELFRQFSTANPESFG